MKNNFYKILSIILSVAMIFSVCGTVASADTTFGENAYFVKNGGTGDGRSDANPAPTVYAVIAAINEDGLTAGDTANIYIMQNEDWKDVNSTVDGSTNPVHGLTAWAVDSAVPEAHTAQLIVQPYSGNTGKTYLATGDKYGIADYMEISGPTTFKNIAIITGAGYQGIRINGNSVTFDADDDFGSAWGYLNAWPAVINERNSTATFFGAGGTVTEEVNINYNHSYSTHSIASSSWNPEKLYLGKNVYKVNDVYNEDFNLTFNVLDSNQIRLVFGNSNSDINFKKNLNINIKSLDALVLENKTSTKVTIDGAFQLIKPAETIFTEADSFVDGTNISAYIEDFTGVTVNGGSWYIINESEFDDLLTFTSQAGLYTVKSGYTAIAVNTETGAKTTSENGALKLEAGDYTVTAMRNPLVKDYYVKYGGTGDGRSADSPVATVYDAITLVNSDELGENDIANIYIMQDEDWKDVNSTVDGSTNPVHGLTAWAVDGAVPEAHTAQLIVQPYSGNTGKTYLATGDKYGIANYMEISGPTTFKNIAIITGAGYQGVKINGNSVTFDADDDFGSAWGYLSKWPAVINERNSTATFFGAGGTVTEEVNINYNSSYSTHSISGSWNPEKLYLGKNVYKVNDVYNEDFNLTFNVLDTNQIRLVFGNSNSDINFKKNLNINIKSLNALVLENKTATKVTIDGAFQLIKPSDTVFTEAASFVEGTNEFAYIQEFTGVTVSGGSWYITNATDNSNLLGFTETAGVYTVNSDANYVYAYSEDSDTIYYGTDILTIKEAGSWTVKEVNALIEIDYEPIKAGFMSWIDNGDGTMTAEYVKEGEALAQYSDYINYRGNLTNTHTKLTTGDKSLNVVYFGGSVTNGTGASDRDSTSWRALIGNWISSNFPEATVTNINRAVGESGTYLGSYRVERDVIAENPDLLFVEYSINDYYWGASYEQAALQYETIIRNVREALPECDIVTVLVTDSSQAKHARNGTLHTQAKAHEDMAAIYGISTIHVGRALADSLPEDWTVDDDWMVYMTDTVHPNDTGYKKYYQVIREFMYNSLIYAENDGTITEYELIELQSDSLLDGNITVIEASEELLARSEELGGSGFEYNLDSVSMHNYNGDVRTSAEGAEFVLEMTGTELAAYISKTGTISQFYVKVDDGEYELKDISNKNPTIIFEGLVSKEHTVYIKPVITSDFTGRIAFPAFYSRDAAYQTCKHVHYGDTNADGEINLKDLVNMKKKMVNLEEYCPPVDIDKDGVMASGDLVKLRKHIIKSEIIVWEDEK